MKGFNRNLLINVRECHKKRRDDCCRFLIAGMKILLNSSPCTRCDGLQKKEFREFKGCFIYYFVATVSILKKGRERNFKFRTFSASLNSLQNKTLIFRFIMRINCNGRDRLEGDYLDKFRLLGLCGIARF